MVNNMENKTRFWEVLETICIGLIFALIPFSLFIENTTTAYILMIVSRLVGIFVVLYLIKRRSFIVEKEKSTIKPWYYLPLLILCASNFIVILFQNQTLQPTFDFLFFIMNIAMIVVTVVLEEILFRYLLINSLIKKHSVNRTIIFSSILFGASHLLNISSITSAPQVLLQAIYTVFLGIVLGFIYITSKNIILSMVFHFLFNFLNDYLVVTLFNLKWDLTFYIVNSAIGIIILIYLFLIQKFILKENTLYASEDLDN